MALRSKTVEYAFPTLTTQLNGASRNDFAAITLYIAETSARRFTSVTVRVTCIENAAASGTAIGNRTVGCKLGAVAFSDQSPASENFPDVSQATSYAWLHDFTSYFNTNFGSGTSQTCQVGFSVSTQNIHALTAKIYITYEFEDSTSPTRTKTVRIPIESPTTSLTATLAEIGTNQVPLLDTFLPEAGKTIRYIWYEVAANDHRGDISTDFALELSLDAEAGVSFGTWEMGQEASRWIEVAWVRNDQTTNATHAFKARTTTASRMNNLNAWLCVTYEYDEASTTTVLSSLRMIMPQLFLRTTASDTLANGYRSEFRFVVEEPGPVTLLQSAVFLAFRSMNYTTLNLLARVGGQSARTYNAVSTTSSNFSGGQYGFTHRLDSGGAQGSGLSLARGENAIKFDVYQSGSETSSTPFGGHAIALINYTAAKHEFGSDAHSHTVHQLAFNTAISPSTMTMRTASIKWPIPENLFWMHAAGAQVTVWTNQEMTPTIGLHTQWAPDETQEAGWSLLVQWDQGYGNQNVLFQPMNDFTHLVAKHPHDPTPRRMNPRKTRRYRIGETKVLGQDLIYDAQLWLSYNALPTALERAVTPAAVSVPVSIHRSDTTEVQYSTASMSSGAFIVPCYTTSMTSFAQGYRSGVSAGRSFDFTPSGFPYSITWTPTAMANDSIWLRADLGMTQAGTVSAWADQTGNANNAAQGVSGSRPTYNADGGDGLPSVSFDGTADLLEITDSGTLASTTAFSASLWIKTGATFPTDGTIIGHWGATERFLMRVETGGNLVVSISNGSAGTATVAAALVVSRWYHVAFAYDGAGTGNAGRLKVYINGVQQSPSFSGTVPASTGNPTTLLSIGSRNAASTYFNGSVDDVVFIDGRAMTELEVLTHYLYRQRAG